MQLIPQLRQVSVPANNSYPERFASWKCGHPEMYLIRSMLNQEQQPGCLARPFRYWHDLSFHKEDYACDSQQIYSANVPVARSYVWAVHNLERISNCNSNCIQSLFFDIMQKLVTRDHSLTVSYLSAFQDSWLGCGSSPAFYCRLR